MREYATDPLPAFLESLSAAELSLICGEIKLHLKYESFRAYVCGELGDETYEIGLPENDPIAEIQDFAQWMCDKHDTDWSAAATLDVAKEKQENCVTLLPVV